MPDKILILRPREDCAPYIEAIEAMGMEAVAEPVLTISYRDTGFFAPLKLLPLIFTSANGVRAFARLAPGREHPVYTVGQNTADEAIRLGFTQVETAAGTVDDLIALLGQRAKSGLTHAFYMRGNDVFSDLKGNEGLKSINIDEFVGYEAILSDYLTINTLKSLKNRDVKAVLAFSARGAGHFSGLVRQYGHENALKTAHALCISRSVLESFTALPFKEVVVADTPDRYGMMSLLQTLSDKE